MEKHILVEKKTAQSKSFWKNEHTKAMTRGLIISLPIIIILFLLSLVFSLILGILTPISNILDPVSREPHWLVHILSSIILIIFFYFVGKAMSSRKGKRNIAAIENEYLMQIPLYSTVRDLVQQFAGMQKMPFSQVVLVDPFDNGILMTGFITEEISEDIYTVFVPTAPNPTNGNLYHVPVSRLHFVNTKSDVAMRTVVGMGTGSAALFEGTNLGVQAKKTSTPDVISIEAHALAEQPTILEKR